MAIVRTTKALAKRIDLHYFKKAHPFRTLKSGLSWGVALLALVWLAFSSFRLNTPFMNGPVSTRHQLFGVTCEKCHDPWGAWDSFTTTGEDHPSVSDKKCNSCHEGPPHHWHKAPQGGTKGIPVIGDPACIHCHQEHRGQAALANLPDRSCLECHADLDSHMPKGYPARTVRAEGKKMESFLAGHPEFARIASKKGDYAKIFLNHQVHLRKGLAGLPEGKSQLSCEDCHQPDSTRAYMQAIDYEVNCIGCHPVDLSDDRFLGKKLTLPHDQPAVVRQAIRTGFSALVASKPEEVTIEKKVRGKTKQVPVLDDKELKAESYVEQQKKWVENQVSAAEKAVFGPKSQACRLCHVLTEAAEEKKEGEPPAAEEKKEGEPAAAAAAEEKGASEEKKKEQAPSAGSAEGLPKVEYTAIPERWFVHSKFMHKPHRNLTCTACHMGAGGSTKTSDVLVPGIASCKDCHSTEAHHARANCVECHVYHDKTTVSKMDGEQTISEVLKSYQSSAIASPAQ